MINGSGGGGNGGDGGTENRCTEQDEIDWPPRTKADDVRRMFNLFDEDESRSEIKAHFLLRPLRRCAAAFSILF